MCKEGDILKGKYTVHPIVYLKENDEISFVGCILTHARDYENNIKLGPEHFEDVDPGNGIQVGFDNTYFVALNLEKKADWGPYKKVGKLSQEGLEKIENHLKEENITTWRRYIQDNG